LTAAKKDVLDGVVAVEIVLIVVEKRDVTAAVYRNILV
jgi:hypothetical protein